MSQPRVVVTGMGVCSSVGTGVEKFFRALVEGRSGIAEIGAFDASDLRSRIAGEVTDIDLTAALGRKLMRRVARFTQLCLVATREAVAGAGYDEALDPDDMAVVIGSGIGAIDTYEHEHRTFMARGPGRHSALTIPLVLPNMAAGAVAREFGYRGPNLCVTTACASGANAIGTAFDLIRSGRALAAIAGAAESTISRFCVDGYCQMRALSTRNETPETASRPFSKDRDGFVLAEGAGVLALEALDYARRRGANILAELVGYGASTDGYHLTAPDPEGAGATRAMRSALRDAGLAPTDIEVVNAHGTSTPLGDIAETDSVKKVFGDHAKNLAMHSAKSMTGHALGASAAVEAVASVMTLREQVLYPTVNLVDPDPDCDLDYVPNEARESAVTRVLSNSFAFGGHCASLIFGKAP